jgi:hypothetical protein
MDRNHNDAPGAGFGVNSGAGLGAAPGAGLGAPSAQLGGVRPSVAATMHAEAAAEARRVAGVESFDLVDADGRPHTYLVTLHPAEEGARILWALLAVGGEPLGAVLQSALGSVALEGATLESLLDTKLDTLAAVDWSKVGHDLANTIRQTDMTGLSRMILRHTVRDGAQLADSTAFNLAFRGNYVELMQAVWRVIRVNRFLPF